MADLVGDLKIGRIEGSGIGTEGGRDEIFPDFHHMLRLPMIRPSVTSTELFPLLFQTQTRDEQANNNWQIQYNFRP